MYKICFYVPEDVCEKVKEALFRAGAGKIGPYARCAWQTLGEGQYEPLSGSQPHAGTLNQLYRGREYQVEMVCSDDIIDKVIATLLDVHPYETVAYAAWKLYDAQPC